MTIHITPFDSVHIQDAAHLFCSRYEYQRKLVPALPEKHLNPELLTSRLQELSTQNKGVVATQGRQLVGFMLSHVIQSFRGHRTAYSPEWANATGPAQQREIHREMYARMSELWVADNCLTHLITTLAGEKQTLDSYFWSGFGLVATDALRDLSTVRCETGVLDIRMAEQEDAEHLKRLSAELQAYMSKPPTLMHHSSSPSFEEIVDEISDSQHPTWLAFRNGVAVAYLGLRPACHVFSDTSTTSISRAFAKEEVRGLGVGKALLANAIEWARSKGFSECAVDFEPQNVEGSRFWLRHFDTTCQTVIRHVDLATPRKTVNLRAFLTGLWPKRPKNTKKCSKMKKNDQK